MCLPALSLKSSCPLCLYISLTFLQDLPSTCELEHILSKVLQDLAPMMPFLSIISHYTATKLYFLIHLSFFLSSKIIRKRWSLTDTQFLVITHHTVAPMPIFRWLVEYYSRASMVYWEKKKERFSKILT